jgi:hypothetical protein
MNKAPIGETAKDRRNQWYVGIISVIALLSIISTAILTGVLVKVTTDDHAAAAKQQATITAQNNQISKQNKKIISLEQQHGSDIANESQLLAGIQRENAILAAFAIDLTNTVNAICGVTSCNKPIPPLFTTTTTTTTTPRPVTTLTPHVTPATAPPTTTTTVPRHVHGGPVPPGGLQGPAGGRGRGHR